jgi:hypothetical protein
VIHPRQPSGLCHWATPEGGHRSNLVVTIRHMV